MKTVNVIRILFFAFAVLMLSGVAIAETNPEKDFKALDKDGDGYISINEATGRLDLLRAWVNADKNADGQLEMTEFSAFEVPPAATFEPVNPENPEPGAGPSD